MLADTQTGGGGLEDRVEWLEAGDVYISSPWAFKHSVEYPASTWDTRVVAAQCRLLMTVEDVDAIQGDMTMRGAMAQEAALEAVSRALASADITIPSLEDVLGEHERIVAQDAAPKAAQKSALEGDGRAVRAGRGQGW